MQDKISTIMQHYLLSICLAATIGAAEARVPSDMGDHTVIIIIQENQGLQIGNRGPENVPISGYVDSNTGVVFLDFSQPCGIVHIEFNNLTDESYYDTTVNGDSPVMIPATFSTGLWHMALTVSEMQYLGVFSI